MTITIAEYLIARMEQVGIKQMFGVAGNYTAPLLNILGEKGSRIQVIRNTNEQVAGFAADGYARLKGASAVYVTYSVGAFSAINAIAGSYTEKVPILLINGAPTNKEYSIERNAGLTYAHTTGDMVPDIEMYRNITVAAERIINARQAPFQIDSALTAMITYNRPVYLEITEDVWRKEIEVEIDKLPKLTSGKGAYITKSNREEAIEAIFKNLNMHKKMIFWAGIELQRYNLTAEFELMLKVINEGRALKNQEPIKFITTPLSKSVLSEEHSFFEDNGCVTLNKSKVEHFLGDDGCLLGFGAWTIGKDNGNQNIRSNQTILASHNGLWVGALFFPLIDLRELIIEFTKAFLKNLLITENNQLKHILSLFNDQFKKVFGIDIAHLANEHTTAGSWLSNGRNPILELEPLALNLSNLLEGKQDTALGYDSFFETIQPFIQDKPLVVDAGFPLIGAQSLQIHQPSHFIAQASWLSIGYSVGALTGVAMAYSDKRCVCIVGDGAFQETCQAISDQITLGQKNVIFVLVNGIYGIEQEIVDPLPFIDSKDKFHDYNILPKWNYVKFNESLGGQGIRVDTLEELEKALVHIEHHPTQHYLVEVHIPSTDVPKATRLKFKNRDKNKLSGEDEITNINWPPIGVY
ncbi:thiamine pyrophosphate-binding protein [Myroides odoratus]|uniref:thiamine pyrophosphate-binding protein n=1 Tax=Myroides odoratus TaxID=256 RepID=UPI00333E2C6D